MGTASSPQDTLRPRLAHQPHSTGCLSIGSESSRRPKACRAGMRVCVHRKGGGGKLLHSWSVLIRVLPGQGGSPGCMHALPLPPGFLHLGILHGCHIWIVSKGSSLYLFVCLFVCFYPLKTAFLLVLRKRWLLSHCLQKTGL